MLEELNLTEDDFEISDYDLAELISTKEEYLAFIEGAIQENNLNFLFEIFKALVQSQTVAKEVMAELGLSSDGLLFKMFTSPSRQTV